MNYLFTNYRQSVLSLDGNTLGELAEFPAGIKRNNLLLKRSLRERENGKEQSEQQDKAEAFMAHVELRSIASEPWPDGQSSGATFKCTANRQTYQRGQRRIIATKGGGE